MGRCEMCGEIIEEDYRLGKVAGVWFCSEECEKEWQAMVEEGWGDEK